MGFRLTGFGWWEYKSTVGRGTFQCPYEGLSTQYRIRRSNRWITLRSNRWITLLYIPVIPLGTVARYVQCRSCNGAFTLETLDSAPESEHEERDPLEEAKAEYYKSDTRDPDSFEKAKADYYRRFRKERDR